MGAGQRPDLAARPGAPSIVGLHPGSFVSRSVQARYLGAVLNRVLAELPAWVRVHLHRDRVVDVTDAADGTGHAPGDGDVQGGSADGRAAGRQSVRLDSGATRRWTSSCSQGHLDTGPDPPNAPAPTSRIATA